MTVALFPCINVYYYAYCLKNLSYVR